MSNQIGVNIRKELKNSLVEILYVSQTLIILLFNGQKISITPEIDVHSYDDVVAFLEFKKKDLY